MTTALEIEVQAIEAIQAAQATLGDALVAVGALHIPQAKSDLGVAVQRISVAVGLLRKLQEQPWLAQDVPFVVPRVSERIPRIW